MPSTTDREPIVAPRRYITRSSRLNSSSTSQPSTSIPSSIPAVTRPTRSRVPEKRKALADATSNLAPTSSTSTSRPSRAIKKPAIGNNVSRTATVSSVLSVAPRRRVGTRANSDSTAASSMQMQDQAPASKRITTTMKASKKVHFAVAPEKGGSEKDKENSAPSFASEDVEAPLKPVLKKTTVVAAPVSALAARPKRIVRSKIKPPTGSEEAKLAEETIPALSPMKAKRLARPARKGVGKGKEEEGSDDELLCPTSPGLSKKPKRLPALGAGRGIMEGAELLGGGKKAAAPTGLAASPARRLPISPVKGGVGMGMGKGERESPVKQSLLMSPPKKTPGLVKAKTEIVVRREKEEIMGGTGSKGRKVVEEDEGDGEEDVSMDELSMPTTRKLVFTKTPKAVAETVIVDEESEEEDEVMEDDENRPPAPRGPQMGIFKPQPQFPTSSLTIHVDGDGDVTMNDTAPTAPATKKKHLSPHEGGSSFGLFSIHSDSDESSDESSDSGNASDDYSNNENIAPSAPVQAVTTKLGDMGIKPPTAATTTTTTSSSRTFGDPIIDPALLTTPSFDFSNPFLPTPPPKLRAPPATTSRLPEAGLFPPPPPPSSRTATTKVPLKPAHSPSQRSPSRPPSTHPAHLPLTGASIFLDIHTSDGADGSSLFASILTTLGARVLKSWPWNPDSEEGAGRDPGVTHVVFKLGSARTLSKLKAAREGGWGVKVVGLGWVVECERCGEWVDEGEWEVEVEGEERRRRRKSMEPKSIPVTPVKPTMPAKEKVAPRTVAVGGEKIGGLGWQSEEAERAFRERLESVRRKSLKWAPKVGSPLAKRVWTMDH